MTWIARPSRRHHSRTLRGRDAQRGAGFARRHLSRRPRRRRPPQPGSYRGGRDDRRWARHGRFRRLVAGAARHLDQLRDEHHVLGHLLPLQVQPAARSAEQRGPDAIPRRQGAGREHLQHALPARGAGTLQEQLPHPRGSLCGACSGPRQTGAGGQRVVLDARCDRNQRGWRDFSRPHAAEWRKRRRRRTGRPADDRISLQRHDHAGRDLRE